MSGGCTGGQPGIHWLFGHNVDCVPAVDPPCGPVPDECDPETGDPCAHHKAAMTEGVPDHLYHESCPGVCCGGNEEL